MAGSYSDRPASGATPRPLTAAERQARALQKELQRVREELKLDEKVPFEVLARAFEKRVCALADRLTPAIETALLGTRATMMPLLRSRSTLDAEIQDQSIRLAQLLLSNWHGSLVHTDKEGQELILSRLFSDIDHPLPSTTLVGTSAYAAPIDVTFDILLKYLRETEPQGWRQVHPPSGAAA